jgi:hypothetical protein
MTDRHKKQLLSIGLVVAVGIPLALSVWIVAVRAAGMDIVTACRYGGLSAMLLLMSCIALPFVLPYPWQTRLRGFVVVWFIMSVGFNLVWELPLVLFRSTLVGLEFSRANLPLGIVWWGYTLSDSHYRMVTPFMVSIELWWLLANALAVIGLWLLRRGDALRGYLFMGVGGALQAYNASLYLVANGVMDHYGNVASDSWLAPVLYWGFNLLWTCAATAGSLGAFHLMLSDQRAQRGA